MNATDSMGAGPSPAPGRTFGPVIQLPPELRCRARRVIWPWAAAPGVALFCDLAMAHDAPYHHDPAQGIRWLPDLPGGQP